MKLEYYFDTTVIEVFELSKRLMVDNAIIPRKLFVVVLFLLPNTEGNSYICYNGEQTSEDIYKKALCYLKEQDLNDGPTFYEYQIGESLYNVEESILDLIDSAYRILKRAYNQTTISIPGLISAYAELYYDEYMELMGHLISDFDNRKTTQKCFPEKIAFHKTLNIPAKLSSFLYNLTENYSPNEKKCKICGRDKETQQLIRILSKTNKRNAILVGEPGVGKTALVEKITWQIVTGNCPDKLKDCVVVSLDINAIVAGTMLRGSAEERFSDLIKFLKDNPQVILFIDEVHLLLGAGACRVGELDLANSLKPILARGDTRVIGATTTKEYEEYFSNDGALKRRFEKIIVDEPSSNEVYSMIKNQIKFLEESHGGITISRKLVDFAILNASAFNYETCNPDRTLDLIDKSLTNAELAGRKSVSKAHILSNFNYNKVVYDQMPLEQKIATAYHECGHLIVYKYSSKLKDIHVLAVSIMPADSYLGVNVLEYKKNIVSTHNIEYYQQKIAAYLAGRISEEMFSHEINSGVSDDLIKATKIAKDVITKYALDNFFTTNRSYFCNLELYTERTKETINTRVDEILKSASIYAKQLLMEHKEDLEKLVKALTEHGILSEKDIDEILN